MTDVPFQVGHQSPGLNPEYTVSPPGSGCPLPPFSKWGGTEKVVYVSVQDALRGAPEDA